MKNNSVISNIQQDFTSAEKLQARKNIDAAKVEVSNPATAYNGDLSIDYSSNTTSYQVNVAGNAVGILTPTPSISGMYLGTDNDGHVSWMNNTSSTTNYYIDAWTSNNNNTQILEYITCPFTKCRFSCQVYSYDGDRVAHNISFCPVTQQNPSSTLQGTGKPYVVNMSTTDDTTIGSNPNWTSVNCIWEHPDMRYIAVKGDPNYNLSYAISNIVIEELH